MYIPQTIQQDPSFYPKNWPIDYLKRSHSLENLLCDINDGKKIFMEDLKKLTTIDLTVMIPRRDSTRTMQWCLIHYLSEISHHTGQIAYLSGTINRLRKKKDLRDANIVNHGAHAQ